MTHDRRTRDEIVEAAHQLFYGHGFGHTSLSDIACTGKLKKGNFFYHFKTKSELLIAVIDSRLARSVALLSQLEMNAASPMQRLMGFVRSQLDDQGEVLQHGCSVGTLCIELARMQSPVLQHAREEFMLHQHWLASQFAEMGHPDQGITLATHLLVRVQGAAIMAQALEDPSIGAREISSIACWLQDLASHPACAPPAHPAA
ncbi:TetR/AcrR family transcriptional regulator [Zoogloea sp.]|uniref:TetR/AcrR family transcriptional regulator n=1 Tax=Zoogloea sp. TaxID=49181 RepID=UPI001AC81086|nr:TetR/AcrR family transcriptional regulator [Zoogloea sp.]MBN8285592.1 TetR/AcrR family transcriptional regulator [Zoogloea sp.]MCA0189135.1 TetR/AcrR family transcriptional regulator [Pseudomonadota bacterium]